MSTAHAPVLFRNKEGDITTDDLVGALRGLGVETGDVLLLHTEILRFGRLPEAMRRDPELFFATLVDALRTVVGEGGSVIMTTLSTKALAHGVFDVVRTPSEGGVLTEYFRKRHDVTRTIHPSHSVAILGPAVAHFHELPNDPFGEGSAYDRLRKMGGKLLFLGADFHWCTFNHHIEHSAGVKYRKRHTVDIHVIAKGTEFTKQAIRFTKSDRFRVDFARFRKLAVAKNVLRETHVGPGYLAVANMQDLHELGVEALRKEPYFFLRVTPIRTYWIRAIKERMAGSIRKLRDRKDR